VRRRRHLLSPSPHTQIYIRTRILLLYVHRGGGGGGDDFLLHCTPPPTTPPVLTASRDARIYGLPGSGYKSVKN